MSDTIKVRLLTPLIIDKLESSLLRTNLFKVCESPFLGLSDFARYGCSMQNNPDLRGDILKYDTNIDYVIDDTNKDSVQEDVSAFTSIIGTYKKDSKLDKYHTGYMGLRPILKYSDIIGKCLLVEDSKIKKVTYGEYPQTAYKSLNKQEFDSLLRDGRFIKTGKTYSVKYHVSSKFEVLKLDEFYDTKTCDKFIYDRGYLIKVEPISWLVDQNNDLAISEASIIGKRFGPYFPPSVFLNELNSTFINDIKPSDVKSILNDNKKAHMNDDLQEEINSINSLCSCSLITDIISSRIDKLIDDYNRELDLIKKGGFFTKSPSDIKRNLLVNLGLLKDKLVNFNKDFGYLNESIKLIDSSLEVFNNSLYRPDREDVPDLVGDLLTIRDSVYPSLNKDKQREYSDSFKSVFNEYRDDFNIFINEYLDNISFRYKFSNSDDIEISIREAIHSILESLNGYISRDTLIAALREIMNNTELEIDSISKSGVLKLNSFYLKTIRELYNSISSNPYSDRVMDKVKSIMNFDIDGVEDSQDSSTLLERVIVELEKVLMEIDEYKNNISDIDSYKFNRNDK